MKLPEGWRKHANGSCTFVIGSAVHIDKSVKPLVLGVNDGEIVWPDINGCTSYTIAAERYKDVLACFVHTDAVDEARDLFTASNALRRWDANRILESPELELQAIQKAFSMELLDFEEVWYQLKPHLVHAYRAAMTNDQWECLLWYVLSVGIWDYEGWNEDHWGDEPQAGEGELLHNYIPLVMQMLRVGYPHVAAEIELFSEQIVEAMPTFEMNRAAARDYVQRMVAPKHVEQFELPNLDV